MSAPDRSGVLGAVRRCWLRARELGASPEGPGVEAVLDSATLQRRREPYEELLRKVPDLLAPVIAGLSDQDYRLLFADRDGVVLHAAGGGQFQPTAERVRLIEGSRWDEETHGTNAIGTALREAVPVAVHGRAHFVRPNHELVCYAAPVRDPFGTVLGVLDATSFATRPSPLASTTVIAAARMLEECLRQQAFADLPTDGGLLQRLMSRFPGPALLIERPGRVTAANPAALARLELAGRPILAPDGLHRVTANLATIDWERLEEDALVGRPSAIEGQTAVVEPLRVRDGRVLAVAAFLETRRPAPRSRPRPDPFRHLVGSDAGLRAARDKAREVARSRLPVILLAETGTGKELMARAIHEASARANRPFVPINCGALSPDLLEAELFGHAPHAYTGASREGRPGRLADADGGTLFLDEVAEMSPRLQVALLRFLEDGSFHPVGGGPLRRADVRIISATCRDLPRMVTTGHFRQDLYYRLCGAPLTLPPLRQRDDLPELASALLADIAEREGLSCVPRLSPDAVRTLSTRQWPGNVRELKTALHYASVMAGGATIDPAHFPALPESATTEASATASIHAADPRSMDEAEIDALRRALEESDGNVSAAARILGVARSTVYRLMKRHHLR